MQAEGLLKEEAVLNVRSLIALLLAAVSTLARGDELAGVWQEYDDQTGKVEALIRIEKSADGSYEGRIEKLLPETAENAAKICSRCAGELHNKPLLGLRILYGMKRKDKLNFDGGEVIDPDEGKVYRCQMRLSEDGKTLTVTGYIGISWFGQSEVWRRKE